MVWSMHARLWVVLYNTMGRYHPVAQGMYIVVRALMDWGK